MAKEVSVSGRMKVGTLKKDFKEAFGVNIRVYNGKKFADDDATLASIRAEGAPKSGEVKIVGQSKVKTVEDAFKKELGITIQIEDKKGGLADNAVTLGSLR